ncbi:MAG: hypothetical protein ACTSWN_03790 [Promethearchaeota archaeon]
MHMLEKQNLKNPLILHFLFVKRQPFLISGFLDTDEFQLFKDFVPHCVVHESLYPVDFDIDDEEGIDILAQLMDSESEDLIEGEKYAILINQASSSELDKLSSRFSRSWMASSVMSSIELARRYDLPVFDLKKLSWINFDETIIDVSWEKKILDNHEGQELRIFLRKIYHEAQILATRIINNGISEKLSEQVRQISDDNDLHRIIEIAAVYFELDLDQVKEIVNRVRKPVETGREITDLKDKSKKPKQKHVRPGLISEFTFFTKNLVFKKIFVKFLDRKQTNGKFFTSPLEKYAWLRGEGEWKDGIPKNDLEFLVGLLIGESKHYPDKSPSALVDDLEISLEMFELANKSTMKDIKKKLLQRYLEPDNEIEEISRNNQLQSHSTHRCNQVHNDKPRPVFQDVNAMLTWINTTFEKLLSFFDENMMYESCLMNGIGGQREGDRLEAACLMNGLDMRNKKLMLAWISATYQKLVRFFDQFYPRVVSSSTDPNLFKTPRVVNQYHDN